MIPDRPPPLSPIQTLLAHSYAEGAFRDIIKAAHWKAHLATCGDGLFRFLMTELSPSEDCQTVPDALHRLQRAADDIELVYDHMLALVEQSLPPTTVLTQQETDHELDQ